ncbi:hypothetical protein, partial [Streptococcus pneumoniae]|uniref:hypothetical protein n=1 Tax=Streptococcus pneumoniae TaxID=1313 RepID=UPI001954BB99
PRPRIVELREGPPLWIYRLPPAAPRAMLAARVKRVNVEAALAAGEIPDVDLASEVLISDDDPVDSVPSATDAPGRATAGRVAIADYGINE